MTQVDDVKQRLAGSSTLDKQGNVREWFAKVIFETAEAYGIKLTEARIRLYAADLGDLEMAQVAAAFRRCRREGSGFFPSIAELRRHVTATPDDRALLAWSAMEQAAERVGAYQSIEFEDPAAARALTMVFGSWPSWCQHETGPELLVKRQQFLAAYREARRHEAAGAAPIRLSGLLESAGNYQRLPQLACGRVTVDGVVQNITEALQVKLEGKSTRRLPQAKEQKTNGKDTTGEER